MKFFNFKNKMERPYIGYADMERTLVNMMIKIKPLQARKHIIMLLILVVFTLCVLSIILKKNYGGHVNLIALNR